MSNTTAKRDILLYNFFRMTANIFSKINFKRKFIRNEIKRKKGAFVVIANHAAALDFVNLIGATSRPMNFVISNSFYQTLPMQNVVPRLGLIPKQQFQTTLGDIKRMKRVIDAGDILVIYPAGLMSDDGTPTPLPTATYEFLRWLKADVYMAKTIGSYFTMPKWRKGGVRKGKTYIDIYKLCDKEELEAGDMEEIKRKTDEALYFDAYEEQERYRIKYARCRDIEGIENVLYLCPNCTKEFTIRTRDKSTIYCEACGFEEQADEYQFLHKVSREGKEIRYPSRWNKLIHGILRRRIERGEERELSAKVAIHMIDEAKRRFEPAGEGVITLTPEQFTIKGSVGGQDADISVPIVSFAALPYKPGEFIEIQHGDRIYRCFPEDGRTVIKFIDMIKIYYEMRDPRATRSSRLRARVQSAGSSFE